MLTMHCTCWSFNSDEETEAQRDKVISPKAHIMGKEMIVKIKFFQKYYTYIYNVLKVKTLLIHWDTRKIMNHC